MIVVSGSKSKSLFPDTASWSNVQQSYREKLFVEGARDSNVSADCSSKRCRHQKRGTARQQNISLAICFYFLIHSLMVSDCGSFLSFMCIMWTFCCWGRRLLSFNVFVQTSMWTVYDVLLPVDLWDNGKLLLHSYTSTSIFGEVCLMFVCFQLRSQHGGPTSTRRPARTCCRPCTLSPRSWTTPASRSKELCTQVRDCLRGQSRVVTTL